MQHVRSTLSRICGDDRAGIASLRKLLHNSWFQRRWVIQEASLSHETIVHCGRDTIPWSWFADGLGSLQKVQSELGFDGTAADAMRVATTIRRDAGTILQLLWEFHSTACCDARDRIFALYGLSTDLRELQATEDPATAKKSDSNSIGVVMDYSRSWMETYTLLARHLYRLLCAGVRKSGSTKFPLPGFFATEDLTAEYKTLLCVTDILSGVPLLQGFHHEGDNGSDISDDYDDQGSSQGHPFHFDDSSDDDYSSDDSGDDGNQVLPKLARETRLPRLLDSHGDESSDEYNTDTAQQLVKWIAEEIRRVAEGGDVSEGPKPPSRDRKAFALAVRLYLGSEEGVSRVTSKLGPLF